MLFNITNRDGETTLSVFPSNGTAQSVAPSHANFAAIVEHLTTVDAADHDEALVLRLLDPASEIAPFVAEASDGRLIYRDNNLFFDGIPVESAIGRHVIAKIESGDQDYVRLVKFLVRLDANPSHQAQRAVYEWVMRNGLTITDDGRFLGYKSVRADGTSSSRGPNNFIDGVLFGEAGKSVHVPHRVGTVVSKKRADVDDNRSIACSTGLHVGTRDYATTFAQRLLQVAIDPADVVSIPDSDLNFKIRVCRYEILGPADHKAFASPSWTATSRDEVTADELEFSLGNHPNWRADTHVFDFDEEAEYDALSHHGRTLYDNLRTMFAKTHDAALAAAVEHDEVYPAVQEAEEAEREAKAAREAREHDLAFLSKRQRDVYEQLRRVGHSHEMARNEANLTAKDEPVEDSNALETEAAPVEDVITRSIGLVEPTEGTGLFGRKVLRDWADVNPTLRADLGDTTLGHAEVARKYSEITTESSVRRYRKALNG